MPCGRGIGLLCLPPLHADVLPVVAASSCAPALAQPAIRLLSPRSLSRVMSGDDGSHDSSRTNTLAGMNPRCEPATPAPALAPALALGWACPGRGQAASWQAECPAAVRRLPPPPPPSLQGWRPRSCRASAPRPRRTCFRSVRATRRYGRRRRLSPSGLSPSPYPAPGLGRLCLNACGVRHRSP